MGKSEGQPKAARGAEPARGALADVFVGRDRERAELRTAVDAAMAARGSLLLVTGEPGIGKTRLGWEVTEYAHRVGAQPVWGSCWEGVPELDLRRVRLPRRVDRRRPQGRRAGRRR